MHFNSITLTFRLKNILKVNEEVNHIINKSLMNKGIKAKKLNLHALFAKNRIFFISVIGSGLGKSKHF